MQCGQTDRRSSAFDRLYEAIGEIIGYEPPLYLAGGVASASEFIEKYLPGEDARSVFRNVTVAQFAQIRAAKRALARKGSGATKAKTSPIVVELTKRLPKKAKEVTVSYANGAVTLGKIPVPASAFAETMRALAKAEVPTA